MSTSPQSSRTRYRRGQLSTSVPPTTLWISSLLHASVYLHTCPSDGGGGTADAAAREEPGRTGGGGDGGGGGGDGGSGGTVAAEGGRLNEAADPLGPG